MGLAMLAILLQGVWAGVFLEHDGKRDDAEGWIPVHAHGGEVALALAAVAALLTIVHIPLALAIMALAVYVTARIRRRSAVAAVAPYPAEWEEAAYARSGAARSQT